MMRRLQQVSGRARARAPAAEQFEITVQPDRTQCSPSGLYVVSAFRRTIQQQKCPGRGGPAKRGCEQIMFNAETAEAAEKKCLRISLRALRALRSNVAFFHRL